MRINRATCRRSESATKEQAKWNGPHELFVVPGGVYSFLRRVPFFTSCPIWLTISKTERDLATLQFPRAVGQWSRTGYCSAHLDSPGITCAACWGPLCETTVGQHPKTMGSARSSVAQWRSFSLSTGAAYQQPLLFLRAPSSHLLITTPQGHLLYPWTLYRCHSYQQEGPRLRGVAPTSPYQPNCRCFSVEAVGRFFLPPLERSFRRMSFRGVCPRRVEPDHDL